MGEERFGALEKEQEVSSGQGCGKSDLLALVQEQLGKRNDCRVIAFLDNRDKVVDGVDFYKDVFLEKLANLDRRLVLPVWHRLAGVAEVAFSLLQRVSLLVYVAIPVFTAVIGYILPNVQLFFELIYWAQLWQNSGVPTPTLTGGAQWIAICLSSRSTVWSANIIKPLCETARCVTVAFPRL